MSISSEFKSGKSLKQIAESRGISYVYAKKSLYDEGFKQYFNAKNRGYKWSGNTDVLSDKVKEVYEMYLHGIPYKDISTSLKIPIGTVRSRIYRAKRILP